MIESEVLGVVTPEDYQELARLRDESEQARERKIEFVRNPTVTEGDVLSEYRRLTEEESAAWDRYRIRAREILGD